MTDLPELAKECGAEVNEYGACNYYAIFGDASLAAFVECIRAEEREKAEVDARRYRWLRDEENGDSDLCPFVAGDTLDAAIDAARQALEKP